MIKQFEAPRFHPANYNIFQIVNFKIYDYLPRWRPEDPDPMFLTNLNRQFSNIAWHSRYRATYPHTLSYRALRAIALEDIDQLTTVMKNPNFKINQPIDKKYNLTALQFAAIKNKFAIMELLLMYGANINKTDAEGNTPLMLAVNNQCLQSINTLLKNGCDREIANNYGKKPKDKAIQQQTEYISDFIQQYPETKRRFPKFRIKLNIEKQLQSKTSNFLHNSKIYYKTPIKNPFNNFKGEYKISLINYKTISQFIKQNAK